jgi:hypothetical protein
MAGDERAGYGEPRIEDYRVEALAAAPEAVPKGARVAPEAGAGRVPGRRFAVILRGENFYTRAMMPIIRIGETLVTEYRIAPDGRSITCYLDELPPDGARISVSYGPGRRGELAEPFRRAKLFGASGPDSPKR